MIKVEQFFNDKHTFKIGRNIQSVFDGKLNEFAGAEAFQIGNGHISQWLYL